MGDMISDAGRMARGANDHPAVRAAARVGYAASGIVHLLIAWVALGVALGTSTGQTADQSGALRSIAKTSWGTPLLWVLIVGFVGLALWQLTEAVGGWHGEGRDAVFSRVKAVSKAIVYAALAWTAFKAASGSATSSRGQSAQATDDLLSMPGGTLLVFLVGAVVIGVGGYHVYKGWKRKFREDLVGDPGDAAEYAGMAGYIAKGIALIVAGGLFFAAAATGSGSKATGLDGAVREIAKTPFGTILLVLVAVGIAMYGVYSFFRAKYTKV